jgi:hypothetical protein
VDLIAGNLNGPAGTAMVAHQPHLSRFCDRWLLLGTCVVGLNESS